MCLNSYFISTLFKWDDEISQSVYKENPMANSNFSQSKNQWSYMYGGRATRAIWDLQEQLFCARQRSVTGMFHLVLVLMHAIEESDDKEEEEDLIPGVTQLTFRLVIHLQVLPFHAFL